MSNELIKDRLPELAQQVAEIYAAKDRFVYYLLAIAAASIGFAASQTGDSPLRSDHLILAAAVICWGLSFYNGCRSRSLHTAYLESHFTVNAIEIGLEAEKALRDKPLPAEAESAVQGFLDLMNKDIENSCLAAGDCSHWQSYLLLLGFLLYSVWHVMEMSLRTAMP